MPWGNDVRAIELVGAAATGSSKLQLHPSELSLAASVRVTFALG
jgi:hypothetical protein